MQVIRAMPMSAAPVVALGMALVACTSTSSIGSPETPPKPQDEESDSTVASSEADDGQRLPDADSELVFEDSMAINGLYVAGPDERSVLAAVRPLGGWILAVDLIGDRPTYTVVFDGLDDFDALITARDELDATPGYGASVIVRPQAGIDG